MLTYQIRGEFERSLASQMSWRYDQVISAGYAYIAQPFRSYGAYRDVDNGYTVYKVGCSSNPDRRLKVLRRDFSCDFRLIHKIKTNDKYLLESALHRLLSKFGRFREFFPIEASYLSYLCEIEMLDINAAHTDYCIRYKPSP